MQQETGLQNKRVVILGGSSGIGLAVGELAGTQGAKVVVASSDPERVQKAIGSLDGHTQGHTVDLLDEQAIETVARLGEPEDYRDRGFISGWGGRRLDQLTSDQSQRRVRVLMDSVRLPVGREN